MLPNSLTLTAATTTTTAMQANQEKLFKDVVQFSPEKLQGGGGSGLGLFSKCDTDTNGCMLLTIWYRM